MKWTFWALQDSIRIAWKSGWKLILKFSLQADFNFVQPWSADNNYNLISSEDGQDTSACKISGHSLNAFSGKCPEPPNLTRFTKLKWCQKMENKQIMTKIEWVLKVVRIHQHAKFQDIPSMRFLGNTRNPQIWLVSLSQSDAKRRKINRLWP